jgi:hypothetical protein
MWSFMTYIIQNQLGLNHNTPVESMTDNTTSDTRPADMEVEGTATTTVSFLHLCHAYKGIT